MYQNQRVIYNSIDISPKVNDFMAGTQAFAYTAGSYLYVGQVMPFNSLWFELGVVNSEATVPSVSIWWGNSWVPAVDLIDDTSGMTKSGRINWNTDRLKGWDIEQTSEDVAGISAFKIYWKYWVRISWSASFSSGTTLKYVGQKFSDDTKLFSYYPDLNKTDLLTSFASGKTNWNDQHFIAADRVIEDLKKRGIIVDRSQIMDYSALTEASCHKVASLIYRAFGEPYADQLKRANEDYGIAINMNFFPVDRTGNGRLDPVERCLTTNFARR